MFGTKQNNLYISKDPCPPNLCCPLEPSEICEGLEIKALPLPFQLFYTKMHKDSLFSITYHGKFKAPIDPFFFMCVNYLTSPVDIKPLFSETRNWMVRCLKEDPESSVRAWKTTDRITLISCDKDKVNVLV